MTQLRAGAIAVPTRAARLSAATLPHRVGSRCSWPWRLESARPTPAPVEGVLARVRKGKAGITLQTNRVHAEPRLLPRVALADELVDQPLARERPVVEVRRGAHGRLLVQVDLGGIDGVGGVRLGEGFVDELV